MVTQSSASHILLIFAVSANSKFAVLSPNLHFALLIVDGQRSNFEIHADGWKKGGLKRFIHETRH